MRIAIAQINPTLGDFNLNKTIIIEYIHRAVKKRSELIVFPECSLFGYYPGDLLERENAVFEQVQRLEEISKSIPANISILIGVILPNKAKKGRPFFNSAALLTKGKKIKFFHKELLPTGDVFDESRFFEKGSLEKNYFKVGGKKFFLTICEDIWGWPSNNKSPYALNPLEMIKTQKVDCLINMSASPYFLGKDKLREAVVARTARKFGAPHLYVNMVGAQDEIIFDGGSFGVDKKGKKLFQSLKFQEDLNIFDLNLLEPWNPTVVVEEIEELRQALVLGIRDFANKSGIKKVHLGLSGGIDSALVACLATDALGPGQVSALAMPGPFNAPESLIAAKVLAKNLGIQLKSISIDSLYQEYKNIFKNEFGTEHFSVAHENIQARIRGNLLMAHGNIYNSLLLTTGNKSEYATGYCTLYGDMCGGLAPIGDLTKNQVVSLARHYNAQVEIIPRFIIDRPPSAELRPNQKDEDSLPPYDQLDAAVVNIVEKKEAATTSVEKWLLRKLMSTEFKRWQAPPILKVSGHSFGRGRRFPIAHRALKY